MIVKVKERKHREHVESGKDYKEHWKYFGHQKLSPEACKKAWKRVEDWHNWDIKTGRASHMVAPMTGLMCLKNCKNRDIDCDECWHFSKFEENKCG
jgi:hypothetical protein